MAFVHCKRVKFSPCKNPQKFSTIFLSKITKNLYSFSNVTNCYYIDFIAGCRCAFCDGKTSCDVVGLILVIGLVLTGVLTVQEGVAGFGDNIIITIGGLFVLTGGLVKTGLVDLIGRRLYRIAGDNEFVLTALIMVVAAVSASVMKNTTTTAMFVPVVMGLANRAKIAPSKLLMPLAFGAILGRKLHADRNFDKSRGQRRDSALRNGTLFDV